MLTIGRIRRTPRYIVSALLLMVLALSFGRQAIADDNWSSCGLGYRGYASQAVAAVQFHGDLHVFYNVSVSLPWRSGGAVQEARFGVTCGPACTQVSQPSWYVVGNVPDSTHSDSDYSVSAPSATVGGGTLYLVHTLRATHLPTSRLDQIEFTQEDADGHWTPWTTIPDPPFVLNPDTRPAIGFMQNVLYVFVTDKDGTIQMIFNDLSGQAGWTSWSPVTSDEPMASAPTAVALDENDLYLLAPGTNQLVYYNHLIALPGGSGIWDRWAVVPVSVNPIFVTDGRTSKPIGATAANGQLYIAISTPLTTLQFNVMTSPSSYSWAGFSDISGEGFATTPALGQDIYDLRKLYIIAIKSDSSGNDLLYTIIWIR
jgi:hypothetical protein